MPDQMSGLSAASNSRTASFTSPADGACGCRPGGRYPSTTPSGTSPVPTSPGSSTTTGPGRPLRRLWKARRMTLATMSGFQITSPYLDTVR